MKRIHANQILAVLIGALSIAYLIAAHRIPTFPIPRPVDSDAIPKLLGYVMLGLAVWLFFERQQAAGDDTETDGRAWMARWMPVIVTAVAIAVYAATLQRLGFVLASFLLAAGLTGYYGYRRHVANLLVALAVPLVLYLIMTRFMNIHLPRGILPF